MMLHFTQTESTFSYFEATRAYIKRHGKPVALYSDKASVFRSTIESKTRSSVTHFGRAMYELNIDTFCANSSSAKGRIELPRSLRSSPRGIRYAAGLAYCAGCSAALARSCARAGAAPADASVRDERIGVVRGLAIAGRYRAASTAVGRIVPVLVVFGAPDSAPSSHVRRHALP